MAITAWQIPDAVDAVIWAPDDGRWSQPKHVEQFPDKINCVMLHLVGYILEYYYDTRTHERYLRHVCSSVRVEQFGSHWTDFHESSYLSIFWTSVAKIQVSLKSDQNNGHFTGRLLYIFITSRSVLLRMRNVSDKNCRENQNTHFVFNTFFSENRTVYEIMWKNVVERDRPQMIIRCMRIACWELRLQTHTQNM
jgi:hypothetical protein